MSQPKSIALIYLGERVGYLGKIFHLFKDIKGKDRKFVGSFKFIFPGSCYEAEAVGDEVSLKLRPLEVKAFRELTAAEQIEISAQREIVKAHRLLKRKTMAIKKPHRDIKRAVDLLRPFYRSLDRFDQDRFSGYLCNAMSKKAGK